MKTATFTERLNELFDKDPRNDSAIAGALGVSKQAVCAWRNGSRSPKKSMIINLADMYHVDIGWLMGYEDSPEDDKSFDELMLIISKIPPHNRELAKKILLNLIEE